MKYITVFTLLATCSVSNAVIYYTGAPKAGDNVFAYHSVVNNKVIINLYVGLSDKSCITSGNYTYWNKIYKNLVTLANDKNNLNVVKTNEIFGSYKQQLYKIIYPPWFLHKKFENCYVVSSNYRYFNIIKNKIFDGDYIQSVQDYENNSDNAKYDVYLLVLVLTIIMYLSY